MDPNPHESPDSEPAGGITLRRVAIALLWFFAGFATFAIAVWLLMQFSLWMEKR